LQAGASALRSGTNQQGAIGFEFQCQDSGRTLCAFHRLW
jgi:hypothetical protein